MLHYGWGIGLEEVDAGKTAMYVGAVKSGRILICNFNPLLKLDVSSIFTIIKTAAIEKPNVSIMY